MRPIIRWLLRALSALSLLGAIVWAGFWNAARDLPYNEQGRYYDAADAVVFHEQSVPFYAGMSVLLTLMGITCLWIAARR